MSEFKINKQLSQACDELERIADSLRNDTKINVTVKGVNAINKTLDSNINLSAIRKLKFEKFKDNFGYSISSNSVANKLEVIANSIRTGEPLNEHISTVSDVESALEIRLTSHLMSKSEFIRYMRKNKITFKYGYSLDKPHIVYWGERRHHEKHFFFPYQYRQMTKSELKLEERRKKQVRKKASEKGIKTKRENARKEQARKRTVNKYLKELSNDIKEYLATADPKKPLFLDTETTGLDNKDEVIEIAITDIDGFVILDTLIHTKKSISNDAYRVHGISKNKLDDKPTFKEVENLVNEIVSGRDVWIYSADFDIKKMQNSASENWNFTAKSINCLMSYAMSELTDNEYMISLIDSCSEFGIDIDRHRAKSKALASAKLYKKFKGISD